MHLDQVNDPDFYYHVAISKEYLANGIPHTLPQAKDIGWGVQFVDKEFFFHVITASLYKLFGDSGVRATPLIFSGLTILALAWHSFKQLGKKLFWIPFLLLAVDPAFLFRLILVRPHTLAIFLIVLIFLGFYYHKKYVVLIVSIFFALSYHALQVPLLFSGLVFLTGLRQSTDTRNCSYACWFGLVIGSLLNPYFPGQIAIIEVIFFIVSKLNAPTNLNFGNELLAWSSEYVLRYSILIFLTFATAIYTFAHQDQNERKQSPLLLFLFFSICFFALGLLTPRSREYLIPGIFFVSVETLKFFRKTNLFKVIAVIIGLALVQLTLVLHQYDMLLTTNKLEEFPIVKALNEVPIGKNKHILNCSWGKGSFIYYLRPDLTFVDLLDPTFLYQHNPILHEIRFGMHYDQVVDPLFAAQDLFHADYTACEQGGLNRRLDRDPSFRRLFPEKPIYDKNNEVILFEVLDNTKKYFIHNFNYSRKQMKQETDLLVLPQFPDKYKNLKNMLPTGYFNLRGIFSTDPLVKIDKDRAIADCLNLYPNKENLQNMKGAMLIGVGGGPIVTLWLNNKEVFNMNLKSKYEFFKIGSLIPLETPLSSNDTIRLQVCPNPAVDEMGIALSFWTEKQIKDLCKDKGFTEPLFEKKNAPYTNYEWTCLGPIATRKIAWKN